MKPGFSAIRSAAVIVTALAMVVAFVLGEALDPIADVQAGPVASNSSTLNFCFSDGRMVIGNCVVSTTREVSVTTSFATTTVTTTVTNSTTFTTTSFITDGVPPTCVVTSNNQGPPEQEQRTIQDTGSGIASIVVDLSHFVTVQIPVFTVGTTAPVVVTATKTDQNETADLSLIITDLAGNQKVCGSSF
jgi:hypothetical protein